MKLKKAINVTYLSIRKRNRTDTRLNLATAPQFRKLESCSQEIPNAFLFAAGVASYPNKDGKWFFLQLAETLRRAAPRRAEPSLAGTLRTRGKNLIICETIASEL